MSGFGPSHCNNLLLFFYPFIMYFLVFFLPLSSWTNHFWTNFVFRKMVSHLTPEYFGNREDFMVDVMTIGYFAVYMCIHCYGVRDFLFYLDFITVCNFFFVVVATAFCFSFLCNLSQWRMTVFKLFGNSLITLPRLMDSNRYFFN